MFLSRLTYLRSLTQAHSTAPFTRLAQRQGATVFLVFKMTCDNASFVRERRLRDVSFDRASRLGGPPDFGSVLGTFHWPCLLTVRVLSDDSSLVSTPSFHSDAASGTTRRRKNVSQVFFADVLRPSCVSVGRRALANVVPACVGFQCWNSVAREFDHTAPSKTVYTGQSNDILNSFDLCAI